MNLPELSIRRHVLAFMLSGVLVLFGIISYSRLGVDRFPRIEFPVVAITTTQQGANPDIVDASITNVIETRVNSIPGIEHIQSVSSPGVSVVAITFNLDKDVNVAFNEVQAKVNQLLRQLPNDADPPVVAKIETNAQPIMWLALQGDRTQQQLNQYAANVIKKRLETIDGVGEVQLGGRRDRTIRVTLSPERMAALRLTIPDVTAAFAKEHVQLPGGFVAGRSTEFLLKLDLEFHNVRELGELIVAFRDGLAIRLKDIARIEDALADYRQLARFDGKPAVGIGIVKIANTNSVAIANEVKRKLATDIVPQLPAGMSLRIASNDAVYIQQIVDSLKEHVLEGTLLAAAVVLLFLKSLRSTLIIAVAIPVSLLGSIAVMYFADFTFNSMTLLALLLLIGVVVDDSIVVLENIFRHRETLDADPVSAAVNGSREVVFAVIAATLALVSIFGPVMFLGGILGKFFKSFAVIVTFGVLVSLFISLTLTPMLCSRYLRVRSSHGKLYHRLESWFTAMDARYREMLDKGLRNRWKVIGLTVLVVLSSAFFFARVDKTFLPEQDEGRFLVSFKTPLGSSIDYTDGRLKAIEHVLAQRPDIDNYFAAIGLGQTGQVNQGSIFVTMVARNKRSATQGEAIAQLRDALARVPGIQAFVSQAPIIGGARGEPLQFTLSGPRLDEVARLARQLQARLSREAGFGKIDLDLQLELPELAMRIDRTRAADVGLSARDVGLAVNVLMGGLNVAKYNDLPGDGERYDVRLKADETGADKADVLKRIYLRSASGQLVRLDSVAQLMPTLGAASIGKLDLQYAANFFGSPSIPLGEATARIDKIVPELLPAGYTIRYIGQAEEFRKTASTVAFAFVLALVLLYMVLASQFNSFLQPLIVMVAQPLAIIGGVVALWMFRQSLNIYSMIGMVLLIGLVAKNSILLVDLTNQYRAQGMSIEQALRAACPLRMRPVVMTSLTIILALLPAAIGVGAGHETNGPLAVAVIGGMISSTLLTLVVVPAVYSLAETRLERRRQRTLSAA